MSTTRRVWLEKIDADGCYYGKFYYRLMYYLIDTFGERLLEENHRCHLDQHKDLREAIHAWLPDAFQEVLTKSHDDIPHAHFCKLLAVAQAKIPVERKKVEAMFIVIQEYLTYLNALDPSLYDKIILMANKAYVDRIRSLADQFDVLVVLPATNRIHETMDRNSAKLRGTGYFKQDLEKLVTALRLQLPDKTILHLDLNQTMLLDTTKQYILYQDQTKLPIFYGHTHYAVAWYLDHHHDKQITVEFTARYYDDDTATRNKLHQIASTHPQCLPDNVRYTFIDYTGTFDDANETSVQGTGKLDRRLPHFISCFGLAISSHQKRHTSYVGQHKVFSVDSSQLDISSLLSSLHKRPADLTPDFDETDLLAAMPQPHIINSCAPSYP